MHRPPTPPPRVSLVPPPLPEQVVPPPIASVEASPRSLIQRAWRDIKIACVWLLLGAVVGQGALIAHLHHQVAISEHPATSASDEPSVTDVLDGVEVTVDDSSEESTEASAPADVSDAYRVPREERFASDTLGVQEEVVSAVVASTDQEWIQQVEPLRWSIDEPAVSPSIESLIALTPSSPIMHPTCEDGNCREGMESHGTALQWASSPADAYRMANEQGKLVFMIHVSGNFEIPGFT